MHLIPSGMPLGAAVMLALVLRWSPVNAQPTPASPDSTSASQQAVTKAQAKKLTDEAIAAHDAKDYDKALSLYHQAYQLVPHPTLLFNIGQAYRLAGNLEQAELYYRRYVERARNGDYALEARAHIDSLSASTPTPPSRAGPPKPQPAAGLAGTGSPTSAAAGEVRVSTNASGEHPPKRLKPTTATQDTSGAPTMTPDGAQEEPVPRATMVKYASYTLMGFGTVLGAVGIKSTFQESSYVALTIGCVSVGLIGSGFVTYAYSKRQHQRQRRAPKSVAWFPAIGTGFAGIALTGTLP